MTEKWWVVREVFFIVSPSFLNDCYPQCRWCPLSVPPCYSLEEVPGKGRVIHSAPCRGSGLTAPWCPWTTGWVSFSPIAPVYTVALNLCGNMSIYIMHTGSPLHTSAIWPYLQREAYFSRALTSAVQIDCQWQTAHSYPPISLFLIWLIARWF